MAQFILDLRPSKNIRTNQNKNAMDTDALQNDKPAQKAILSAQQVTSNPHPSPLQKKGKKKEKKHFGLRY